MRRSWKAVGKGIGFAMTAVLLFNCTGYAAENPEQAVEEETEEASEDALGAALSSLFGKEGVLNQVLGENSELVGQVGEVIDQITQNSEEAIGKIASETQDLVDGLTERIGEEVGAFLQEYGESGSEKLAALEELLHLAGKISDLKPLLDEIGGDEKLKEVIREDLDLLGTAPVRAEEAFIRDFIVSANEGVYEPADGLLVYDVTVEDSRELEPEEQEEPELKEKIDEAWKGLDIPEEEREVWLTKCVGDFWQYSFQTEEEKLILTDGGCFTGLLEFLDSDDWESPVLVSFTEAGEEADITAMMEEIGYEGEDYDSLIQGRGKRALYKAFLGYANENPEIQVLEGSGDLVTVEEAREYIISEVLADYHALEG